MKFLSMSFPPFSCFIAENLRPGMVKKMQPIKQISHLDLIGLTDLPSWETMKRGKEVACIFISIFFLDCSPVGWKHLWPPLLPNAGWTGVEGGEGKWHGDCPAITANHRQEPWRTDRGPLQQSEFMALRQMATVHSKMQLKKIPQKPVA